MDLIFKIDIWDKKVVEWASDHHNSILNSIFLFFSDKWLPIPIYLLFLWLIYKKYPIRTIILFILPSIAFAILMSEIVSSNFFKPFFERPRPCHVLNLDMIVNCGGKYGFVSSHATNSFAVATLIWLLLKNHYKNMALFLFLWSAIVSISRVYLGKHYPTDVFFGAIVGICIGLLIAFLLKKSTTKFSA